MNLLVVQRLTCKGNIRNIENIFVPFVTVVVACFDFRLVSFNFNLRGTIGIGIEHS